MPKLTIGGDAKGAIKAVTDLAKAQKELAADGDKAAKRLTDVEKAARRIKEANDPQQRYNRQIKEAARLANLNKISLQDAQLAAQRYGRNLERAGQSGKRAFGNVTGQLAGMLAGIVSVSGAIGLLRTELDAVAQREEKRTQTQLNAAQARDVLKRNLVSATDAEKNQALTGADRIASDTKVSQQFIDAALAKAISGSGGDVAKAIAVTTTAAEFLKTSPAEIGDFAGSLADIAKITKDQDALRNLGFLSTVGGLSRVADAKLQASNIPRALIGIAGRGASPEEAGSLFSALSNAAADTKGEASGTAGIQLATQLEKFVDNLVQSGKVSRDVDTFGERVSLLQADRELSAAFLDKASFEAKLKVPIRDLLTDTTTQVAKEFSSFQSKFGTAEQQIAQASGALVFLGEGNIANTAAADRIVSSAAESNRLTGAAGLSNERREEIIELAAQARSGFQFQRRLEAFARTGPTLDRQEAIAFAQFQIEEAITQGELRAKVRGGDNPLLSDSERVAVEKLQEIVDSLKAIDSKKPVAGRAE